MGEVNEQVRTEIDSGGNPPAADETTIDSGGTPSETEKAYESALCRIFGLKDGEELGNVEERIAELEKRNATIVENARKSVIEASIKALNGYDSKLLSKVIDLENVTVDDSGKVAGLEEAVKAAETEFPAVRIKEDKHKPFVPMNPAGSGAVTNVTMNDLIRGKR